eukprot:scaffold22791_cov142-Cylindrotheca_fusiformis.AAC.2
MCIGLIPPVTEKRIVHEDATNSISYQKVTTIASALVLFISLRWTHQCPVYEDSAKNKRMLASKRPFLHSAHSQLWSCRFPSARTLASKATKQNSDCYACKLLLPAAVVTLSVVNTASALMFPTSCPRDEGEVETIWERGLMIPFRNPITTCCDKSASDFVRPEEGTGTMSPRLPFRILRPNPNLEIAFCCRTRNPIYVLETNVLQDSESSSSRRRRRPNFVEESSIRKDWRSQLSHYKYTGWDRGHLAPAADFRSQKEKQQTYNLCNVSPQDPQMNRTIWSRLEEWVRKIAKNEAEENSSVHVVTGPLWLPARQVGSSFGYDFPGIGQPPSLVAVPTHFFKVVVVVTNNLKRISKFACFVIPNQPPPPSASSNDLEQYLVPWTDLESVTGLEFFPNLMTDEWRQVADRLTLEERRQDANRPSTSLLLTNDSSVKQQRKGRKKYTELQHLCRSNKCFL